jgi:hypothetical protein
LLLNNLQAGLYHHAASCATVAALAATQNMLMYILQRLSWKMVWVRWANMIGYWGIVEKEVRVGLPPLHLTSPSLSPSLLFTFPISHFLRSCCAFLFAEDTPGVCGGHPAVGPPLLLPAKLRGSP